MNDGSANHPFSSKPYTPPPGGASASQKASSGARAGAASSGGPGAGASTGPPKPNFRSMMQFLSEFRPISYAVAGLMREGSLYTLTGRTGEGKTSFLIILALAIATGQGEKLIGRKVKKGRVAFATAENPDDLRTRLMVACFVFNIDPSDHRQRYRHFRQPRSPGRDHRLDQGNRRSLHPHHHRHVAGVLRRTRLRTTPTRR